MSVPPRQLRLIRTVNADRCGRHRPSVGLPDLILQIPPRVQSAKNGVSDCHFTPQNSGRPEEWRDSAVPAEVPHPGKPAGVSTVAWAHVERWISDSMDVANGSEFVLDLKWAARWCERTLSRCTRFRRDALKLAASPANVVIVSQGRHLVIIVPRCPGTVIGHLVSLVILLQVGFHRRPHRVPLFQRHDHFTGL